MYTLNSSEISKCKTIEAETMQKRVYVVRNEKYGT